MRLVALLGLAVLGLLTPLALPARSVAAVPPNRDDPCSEHGRNVCGTLGVGFYESSGGGLRWFGDFRGAVAGAAHTFCLDARFWYASPAYRYEQVSAAGLRNRDGEPVSLESQERMAYAIWTFGRTTNENRQAAVMLYVHALMRDAEFAGDVDPVAVNPGVLPNYQRIERDAARYHGPYRIEARFSDHLTVSRKARVSVRVLAASGAPVRNARLSLAAEGAAGLPSDADTGTSGIAHVTLTPQRAAGLRLTVTASRLASTRPRVYTGTTAASAVNGQRLAAPGAQRVTKIFTRRQIEVAPIVSTQASSQTAGPGARITAHVSVKELGGKAVRVRATLWGPYRTRAAITCTGSPVWTGSFVAKDDDTYTTVPVLVRQPGYYSYTESIRAGAGNSGFAGSCGNAAETMLVRAQPSVTTVVSHDVVSSGARISDLIRVRGLGKTAAKVVVELFGPLSSRSQVNCSARPYWTGEITVAGDGQYRTPAVKVIKAGIYAFRERLLGTELLAAVTTPCALLVETSVVAPQILTGRGDTSRRVSAPAAGAHTPVRVRLPDLGIDAPVAPAGIDTKKGVLGIPASIDRVGWWRDGSAPASGVGAILLAGHVDDAKAGIGAFFAVRRANIGDVVELMSANGRVHRYHVVSLKTYPKGRLPLSIYSRRGATRLVLVTCGGPFDEATGHYRDNIVLTAVAD